MNSSISSPDTFMDIEAKGKKILEIAKITNNSAVANFLTEVLEKLPNEEFYLAILGLFKRGKSTLINAMLGAPILPTGVIPVTSVITRIKYGSVISARITFGDNSTKEVPVEGLSQYVSEIGNPNNSKNVTIADVYVPAQILKDGLILIDTPGVGSTYTIGTKVTFQFLDRVDFAIFVLAVDPPVGQQELELLNSLGSKSQKILFALNKIDYVDPPSVAESVNYCQKIIQNHLGNGAVFSLVIYPVSAKLALEGRLSGNTLKIQNSGIEPLELALKESLINQKESLMIRSTTDKLRKSATDLMTYIQLEIASLKTPLDRLSHLQLEFEQYLSLIEQRKRDLFYVIDGRAKEIVAGLDEDLASFKKEHETALLVQVETFAEAMLTTKGANSREIVSSIEEYLRKSLIETYSEFMTSEDQKIRNAFLHLASEANERMSFLISDVKHKAALLFGFRPAEIAFHPSIDYETKFYYHLDPIFITGITFSGGEIAEWVLPKSLFKRVLEKQIRQRIKDEFETNGGRIRYDYFVTRLNQALLQLKRDINQTFASSTETVKNAITEAECLRTKNEAEVNSKIGELRNLLCTLKAILEE